MRQIAAQHGPEAVCFSMSSPSTRPAMSNSTPFLRRLMNAFGTSNVVANVEICGWGRAGATTYTYGVPSVATSGGGGMPDIANTGCLILWGSNPSYTRLTHATAVAEALKRGMRLIVVDPNRVGLANKADVWLRVRPGTDGALALSIAHVMLEQGWYRPRFHPHLEQRPAASARRHRSPVDRGRPQPGMGSQGRRDGAIWRALRQSGAGRRIPRRHARRRGGLSSGL